ncbi:hypothetical protein V6N11_061908 [Hibiscus sabdariffa]|uniref:Leucine-rich repeat-containing N-terminal plant-type domain-containing protein n=1 Tax=Hibiscus sabdariffa TaxID=183260 RepID=A0ABR2N7J1_9ROSI
MAKTGFLPLMFLLPFTIFRNTLSSNSLNITPDQSALLALKSHITHDPHNLLATNWSTSISVCNWIGVTCGSKHHRVTILDLSSMDLTGTIPSQLGNLSFLVLIRIRHNSFHGSLPTELTSLHRLKYLSAGDNSFSGEIPSWFGYFPKLRGLSLYTNNFSGVIPSTFGNLSKLKILLLYNNNLKGHIPSSICNLSSLRLLFLSKNNLDGEIPKCIGNMSSSLSYIELVKNNFHGKIPENFGKDCKLQSFRINHNQVEGSLPRSLGNCKDLKLLDVGNNYLNDTFPDWLGNLDQLQVLILRSNRFYGQVDRYEVTVSFARLRVIDISHNNFSGYLPMNFFENLHAIREGYEKSDKPEYMMYLLANTTWNYAFGLSFTTKGLETEFEKLLIIWSTVDFSNNQFFGEIPKTLGELHSLVVLNLSHNCLTGPIPSSLGDLSELESLDLSCNELYGRIPIELNNLGFLEVLNLSHNHLKGPIPQGKQFDTFNNDSYIGNLGLCGLPLSENCNNDEETSAKLDRDDNDEISWKFSILMGYGCGLVLGLSMGYTVFTTGKPWWFIRIYERIRQKIAK